MKRVADHINSARKSITTAELEVGDVEGSFPLVLSSLGTAIAGLQAARDAYIAQHRNERRAA